MENNSISQRKFQWARAVSWLQIERLSCSKWSAFWRWGRGVQVYTPGCEELKGSTAAKKLKLMYLPLSMQHVCQDSAVGLNSKHMFSDFRFVPHRGASITPALCSAEQLKFWKWAELPIWSPAILAPLPVHSLNFLFSFVPFFPQMLAC